MKSEWQESPLAEVCEIKSGSTPSKTIAPYWEGGTIPWFTIDDLRNQGSLITSTSKFITPKALNETSVKLLPPGTVLLCCTASVGAVALSDISLTTNQQFNGLIPNRTKLLPRYLFHYCSTMTESLLSISGKTTVDFIPISRLRELRIAFPSLKEQERIVAILDEAFQNIDKAEENSRCVTRRFSEYLEAAITEAFRPSRGGKWQTTSLGDLSQIDYGFTESAVWEEVGPRFLRITDIQGDMVDWEKVPYCKIDASEVQKFALRDGDIVFARTGATTGKSYLIQEPPPAVFASYLIRVQTDEMKLSPRLLSYFFRSAAYWESVRAGTSGSAQGGFNATKLAALQVTYPSDKGEQETLVSRLRELIDRAEVLKEKATFKIAALEALKQSLLHQAFSGNL